MATKTTKKAAAKKAAKSTPKPPAKPAPKGKAAAKATPTPATPAKATPPPVERDARLPRPGGVLTRTFQGKEIKVQVLDARVRLRGEDLAVALRDREGGQRDELERVPLLQPPEARRDARQGREGRARDGGGEVTVASRETTPRPLLAEGALYWSDNGRVICAKCAGQSALYTGRDISGQKVERITIEDVRAWPEDLGTLHCESNCTALAAVAGPDGWPIANAAVCPCWCEGRIADHDERGWGPWACPVCGDDSDTDLGKPCTGCAAKGGTR